jgi:hypothetical protein
LAVVLSGIALGQGADRYVAPPTVAASAATAVFDLLADPGELVDVAASYPTVMAALQSELDLAVAAATPTPADAIDIDPALREQLRSLGYIQ